MKYTRIDIKSKDDNPKERGVYLTEFGWLHYNGKWIYPQNKGTTYLRGIDWYLIEDTEPAGQVGEWIDVNDKMPEGQVLLLTLSRVIVIGDWYKEKWRTDRSYWQEGEFISVYMKSDITHWMPLPDIPSESKQDKDKACDSFINTLSIEQWFGSMR